MLTDGILCSSGQKNKRENTGSLSPGSMESTSVPSKRCFQPGSLKRHCLDFSSSGFQVGTGLLAPDAGLEEEAR